MNEEAIKRTMMTAGWLEILKIFEEEIGNNLKGINTDKAKDDIAIDYIGRIEAEKIVNNVFKKLNTISHVAEATKEIYK